MNPTDPQRLATREQSRAANPGRTAWVDASAGSGKTKVLVDRVLRLLLAGTPPHRLLCLTYTKAAAANMANRLTATLAEWATLPEPDLAKHLRDLTGNDPPEETILSARRLFATTLDAPGGMQFQTIHGFCQSLLARFPLEAGVPVGFTVLDERASCQLMKAARQDVLDIASRTPGGEVDAAIARLLEKLGPERFHELEQDIVSQRGLLEPPLQHGYGPAIIRLRDMLDLPENSSEDALLEAFCTPGAREEIPLRAAIQVLAASAGKTDRKNAAHLDLWLACNDVAGRKEMLAPYLEIYLTKTNEPRKDLASKAVRTARPDIADALEKEARAVCRFVEQCRLISTYQNSAALAIYAGNLLDRYRQLKKQRLALDFDDLIERATALVSNAGAAAWVLYKLDGGIEHVLVDEAQDTNPLQWRLLEALTGEFYSGSGRHDSPQPRTLFAVGDFKQSIFSFQGARPHAFLQAREKIRKLVEAAGQNFEKVDFTVSFRSVTAILQAVDSTFRQPDAGAGLPDYQPHISSQPDLPGRVDLWPPAPGDDRTTPDDWHLPVTRSDSLSPVCKLARILAAQIRHWIETGESLPARGRPMRYGDIMVLVRTRGRFVPELIRACKQAGVPVSGADRMILTEQLAVEDLLAFADFLLLPEDDLALACVLRSPLVGLSEDDLFTLAHGRTGSLWQSLGKHPPTRAIASWLAGWLKEADRITPYTLFARLLAQPCPADESSGRRAMLGRLGTEAKDPLDELLAVALEFEQRENPSLQGFVQLMRSDTTELKREMEQAEDQVRIMTVHGAKGLEAPVVILADARTATARADGLLLDPDAKSPPLLVPQREDEDPVARQRRMRLYALDLEEYHRLLYVALTRAEDWLIVTGWLRANQTGESRSEPTRPGWYDMVEAGLRAGGAQSTEFDFTFLDPALGWRGPGLTYCQGQPGRIRKEKETAERRALSVPNPLPEWLSTPPAAEPHPPRPLAPSRPDDDEAPVLSPFAPEQGWRWQRGLAIHRLLQTLPDLPPTRREQAGLQWLTGWPRETARNTVAEVLAVIEGGEFSHLFGPGSRAEVPITAKTGARVLAGQIDRLLVTPEAVWIVDFKTNRPPARTLADIPPPYLRQLAAYRAALTPVYPGRRIETLLLWTNIPALMPIPGEMLDAHAP